MELVVKIVTEQEEKKRYYPTECDVCGWIGCSSKLEGGGAIADTGDFNDVYCPVCGNVEPGESENEIPLTSYIDRLNKAHDLVKKYKNKAESCDCSKHIYGHLEVENNRMGRMLNDLRNASEDQIPELIRKLKEPAY